jgi:hypothetical protein
MLYDIDSRKFQSYCALETCAICLQQLGIEGKRDECIRTSCGHQFHLVCLDAHHKAAERGHREHGCPVCRTWIGKGNVSDEAPSDDRHEPHPHDTTGCAATIDYATALDHVYGSVACVFQLRAAREGFDDSAEVEAAFMAMTFLPLMRRREFTQLVTAYVDATLAVIRHGDAVAPLSVRRVAMSKDPRAVAQYADEMSKLSNAHVLAKWSAVSYVYACSEDMKGWMPYMEAKLKADMSERKARLAAEVKKQEGRYRADPQWRKWHAQIQEADKDLRGGW